MQKKIQLTDLKVSSFQTGLDGKNAATIKGGANLSCRTYCNLDCQSAPESNCGSCGGGGTTGGGGTKDTFEIFSCQYSC